MFSYFFLGFVLAIGWMILAWVLYLFVKNPAIVDLAWTLCMGGLSFLYIFVSNQKLLSLRLILIAMIIWTFRLALLISYRLVKYKTDGRYQTLDKSFENFRKIKYFFFFLMQGISALVFTLPVWLVASFGKPYFLWNILSASLVFIALLGVILSDIQLQTFIRQKQNKGKVCKVGLWRYSRHPNYFFEWMFWMGMMMFALPLHLGFVGILSPLFLLIAILFFTGIPPTEKQALLSKGQEYREYQKTTSAFIPWFVSKV
jgi:steroid 5-alpha reductase family enzyme